MSHIRAKAVCLFQHKGKVLLAEGFDPQKEQHYLLPVGGGVEFGEHSKEAAIRETLEEIGAVVLNARLLGISENIFLFDGLKSHEIVFVYEADFEDKSFYEKKEVQGIEDNGVAFMCRWVDVEWLRQGHIPFFPAGIIDML